MVVHGAMCVQMCVHCLSKENAYSTKQAQCFTSKGTSGYDITSKENFYNSESTRRDMVLGGGGDDGESGQSMTCVPPSDCNTVPYCLYTNVLTHRGDININVDFQPLHCSKPF